MIATVGAFGSSVLGTQMGMVIPMVLLVPPAEFGAVSIAVHRIIGIVIALAVLVIVSELWPAFPKRAAETATKVPSPTSSAEGVRQP